MPSLAVFMNDQLSTSEVGRDHARSLIAYCVEAAMDEFEKNTLPGSPLLP
jgi:hypothetical protein